MGTRKLSDVGRRANPNRHSRPSLLTIPVMAPQSSTTTATVEAPADASKLEAKASKSLGRLDSSESFDPATYGIDDKLSYATISERCAFLCPSEPFQR